ncbi:hypothetical protein [Cognatishimia sp. F0-27]|uniref:hypothetical protein n=1 Tax=Cognatishimia sp. F0-27 TaxID=2816855 RepID=UPI001D0C4754|nr:hypothetical protein [Cognatishimia sp. F0-27]MCC1492314.1 hypothetical protein [Cognatishimia sp. F0-27]
MSDAESKTNNTLGVQILENLRDIRAELNAIKGRLDLLEARAKNAEGMSVAMAGYVRGVEEHVVHIEQMLGIDE